MSLKRAAATLAFVAAAAARPASAGPVKYLASEATAGAVEQIEPALARTIGDIGTTAGTLVDETSQDLGTRLDQVDGILEKRLLQVNVEANDVVDNGLDKVDGVARRRITQVGAVLDKSISGVNADVADRLQQADQMLTEQLDHVGQIVNGTINQADQVIGARIEQLDEIAGRRLGDVDVVATKQRLGLERTIIRAAWLIGLVVFVIVVLKALWGEYVEASDDIARTPAGTARARAYVTTLAPPLLKHGLVAAIVAVLLATVPQRLPMAAVKDQQALVAYHAGELAKSVDALDWTEVRFHASELEFLDAPNTGRYKVLEAKADVLRDLLGRPTSLATTAGAGAILARVEAVERLAEGRLDPDAATARALVVWKQGETRAQEHQAAALAARALWSSSRGFTLAPMARLLVEAYVHAPDPAEDSSSSAELEPSSGMAAMLALPASPATGSPFEAAETLFHLMERVDSDSSAAFVAMIEAQALVATSPKGATHSSADIAKAKKDRNDQAQRVVTAWETFDSALRTTPILAGNALVLQVFRLNDVFLSHALWYTAQPDTAEWPKELATLQSPSDRKLKLAIAPARVTWARRYAPALRGPVRGLVQVQESQRYEVLEKATLSFERSYGVFRGAPARARRSNAKGSKPTVSWPPAAELNSLAAANDAAALGLYVSAEGTGARGPLALKIAGNLDEVQQKLHAKTSQAIGQLETNGYQKLQGAGVVVNEKLAQERSDLVNKLLSRLSGRTTRLI